MTLNLAKYQVMDLVVVNALTGNSSTYDSNASSTVAHLKDMVEVREGVPPDQQRLVVGGEIMENNEMILFYVIHKELVLLQILDAMQIFVKFPKGKTITLGVFVGNTMGALKANLQELEGVSIGRQRLIFAGGQLDDWHI